MNITSVQRTLLAFTLTLFVIAQSAWAQAGDEPSPLANFVFAGYGSATYGAVTTQEFANDFTAAVSPVILYSMGSDFLFETELEFGLSGQSTTTALEYAQVDYLGFDRVQVIAGKFLVPFGLFTERYHATWINKLPTAPLLYGHAHGGVAEGALLPMLSDAGLLLRGKQPLGTTWSLDASFWVTQGPRMVGSGAPDDEHADDEGEDGHAHKAGGTLDEDNDAATSGGELNIPDVGFGISFADNNKNKMLGGRLGLVQGAVFESYVSGFFAMYDEDDFLHIYGLNWALDIRKNGFEVRGEAAFLHQEFPTDTGYDEFGRWAYYLQASRRIRAFEPVARWSHLMESDVHGSVAFPERREIAIGLNYWISPSIPLKAAYAVGLDGEDRLLIQWAFGF